MGYTFISYSRKQLYFAESIALHLQKAGIEVWFDLQKLSPGVNWATALREGYGNCERLVFVASQAALQSPYVQVEWETALRDGREVIVVFTERVALPESLRNCAVYDARTHFDQTIQSLVDYLRSEKPARRDPIPAPGKSSLLSNKMPFDIWFTVCVMLMPTITVWITMFTLPLEGTQVDINLPAILEKYRSHIIPFIVYLLGFLYGINLAQVQIPRREFLRHEISYEELKKVRWKLLKIQLGASILCLLFTVLGSNGLPVNRFGYLILIFPLVTVYWSFWTLGHSPDILRWLPSGEADQDVRESIQGELVTGLQEQSSDETITPELVTYAIHHHPADSHIAEFVGSALQSGGCQPAPDGRANIHLIIVSNRTSKEWLIERNAVLSGQIIHILATNINTPPEIQPVLQTQWVDFRTGREKTLQALTAHLTRNDATDIIYGMQISPTGFDNKYAFPRSISILFAVFIVIDLLAFWGITRFLNLPDWAIMPLSVPLILYLDALIMRKTSLPALFHKTLRDRVAWFAGPAPRAQDAIGNMDRKYVGDLAFSLLRSS